MAWALGSAFAIAGFAVPWKLASTVGAAHTNTLLLLAWAALFSTTLGVARTGRVPRPRRFDWLLAGALAVLTLAGNLASAEAIRSLSPALLTVVQRSEVVLVALIAWPVIGERVDRVFWVGAAVAVCGLVILQGPFDGTGALGGKGVHATGMAWAFGSAICFASMAVVTRLYIRRVDPIAVNSLRLVLAVAFWFAANGVGEEIREIGRPQVGYTMLAAFFGPFAGRLCMMQSARYLEARLTTLATLVAPVATLVLAWIVLSDLPTARQLVGGGVMLLGIAIPVAFSR
jgi:drug/metabolite transporter (DMT)-like permease